MANSSRHGFEVFKRFLSIIREDNVYFLPELVTDTRWQRFVRYMTMAVGREDLFVRDCFNKWGLNLSGHGEELSRAITYYVVPLLLVLIGLATPEPSLSQVRRREKIIAFANKRCILGLYLGLLGLFDSIYIQNGLISFTVILVYLICKWTQESGTTNKRPVDIPKTTIRGIREFWLPIVALSIAIVFFFGIYPFLGFWGLSLLRNSFLGAVFWFLLSGYYVGRYEIALKRAKAVIMVRFRRIPSKIMKRSI